MKLKFKNQDFQTNAVTMIDLFADQENTYNTFLLPMMSLS